MKSFILSSSGINNILQEEKEFTFVFGKYEIRMNNINSEFISPIVSFIHHYVDPTINKYYFVPIEKHNFLEEKDIFSEDVITLFQDISKGKTIDIKDDQISKLKMISIFIGNEELFKSLHKQETNEIQYLDEIIKILEICEIHPKKTFLKIDELIDIISSNFYKIEQTKMKNLGKGILYEIITNEHLKLANEDSLFEFIEEIFEQTTKDETRTKNEFYENIYIDNLSDEQFIKMIRNLDNNEITRELWNKLVERFIHEQEPNKDENENENKIQTRYTKDLSSPRGKPILYDNKNSMTGIINFITNECGGNVQDKGVVSVTASSENSSSRLAKHAVNLNDTEYFFRSKNVEKSWLKYDFKEKKIHPTGYSIRSIPLGQNYDHPQNWVIEVSNTGREEDWKILDEKNNCTELNDSSVTRTFNIQEKLKPNEFFRFIRIRQTGKNAQRNYFLSLSALEYFGYLI